MDETVVGHFGRSFFKGFRIQFSQNILELLSIFGINYHVFFRSVSRIEISVKICKQSLIFIFNINYYLLSI